MSKTAYFIFTFSSTPLCPMFFLLKMYSFKKMFEKCEKYFFYIFN